MVLILALVVTFASIVVVVKQLKDKRSVSVRTNEAIQQPINIFMGKETKDQWISFVGHVSLIAEKKLTVKKENGTTEEFGIDGSTPVFIKEVDGQLKLGQIADVRIGDFVDIQYDCRRSRQCLV